MNLPYPLPSQFTEPLTCNALPDSPQQSYKRRKIYCNKCKCSVNPHKHEERCNKMTYFTGTRYNPIIPDRPLFKHGVFGDKFVEKSRCETGHCKKGPDGYNIAYYKVFRRETNNRAIDQMDIDFDTYPEKKLEDWIFKEIDIPYFSCSYCILGVRNRVYGGPVVKIEKVTEEDWNWDEEGLFNATMKLIEEHVLDCAQSWHSC